jgi:hypothetical protein
MFPVAVFTVAVGGVEADAPALVLALEPPLLLPHAARVKAAIAATAPTNALFTWPPFVTNGQTVSTRQIAGPQADNRPANFDDAACSLERNLVEFTERTWTDL